jgi:hypothetical protein
MEMTSDITEVTVVIDTFNNSYTVRECKLHGEITYLEATNRSAIQNISYPGGVLPCWAVS